MTLISFNNMSKKTTLFKTICITSVICLTFLMCGMSRMFTSYMISQLRKDSSYIKIDEDEASWLGSLSSLCNPVGFLFGGFSMDMFGRKWTTQCTFLPFIAGWVIITSAESLHSIFLGVALHGIASGMTMVASVYVSEISSSKHRGFALSFLALSYMLGTVICSALQCLISWRHTAMCFFFVSIAMLALIQLIPESPYWLIMKGLPLEASNVLDTIRGYYGVDVPKKSGIQLEIIDICEHVHKPSIDSDEKISVTARVRLKLISLYSIWKQMLILVTFATLHRLSGFLPLTQYTVLFFDELGTPVDGNYASLIHSVVCFLTTFALPYFVHFYNRRILLCITSVIAGCGMILTWLWEIGMCKYPDEMKSYFWIALLGVYIYDIATTTGITSVLVMLPAELLPTDVSGSATTLYNIIASLITMTISKTYFKVLGCVGLLWLLFSFIVSSFLIALLSVIWAPETRGKTLREIQLNFNKSANADFSAANGKKEERGCCGYGL